MVLSSILSTSILCFACSVVIIKLHLAVFTGAGGLIAGWDMFVCRSIRTLSDLVGAADGITILFAVLHNLSCSMGPARTKEKELYEGRRSLGGAVFSFTYEPSYSLLRKVRKSTSA